ncbi:MAG TPA: VOC family protein [Rhizobiaceae bacterium]|nr:VOC family protein [Rhizobiaceae bacterium]
MNRSDARSIDPRSVDHCVLPVAALSMARERLETLGFTVAADALHPFGTGNCCVFFADNTYLEPLAVVDATKAQASAQAGNAFTRRDLAYRYRCGDDGFSALVFKTDDAKVDHAGFLDAGISGGRMLEFARDFTDASGNSDTASFRLAFAADPRAPDCFFFTCERVRSPQVDRSALQRHENGVTGLKAVTLSAPCAADFTDFLSVLVRSGPAATERRGIVFAAGNAEIRLLDDSDFAKRFGAEPLRDPGLRLRSIVFGVRDMEKLQSLLRAAGASYDRHGSIIAVPPAAGQGAFFMFEAE